MFRYQGQASEFTAAEINRWNKIVDQQARNELVKRLPQVVDSSRWPPLAIRNDTTHDLTPGEHCSLEADLLWSIERGQSTDIVAKAAAPDKEKLTAVVIDEIEQNGVGYAIILGGALARVSGGTGNYAEVDGSYVLKPTETITSIRLLDTPNATNEKLIPVLIGLGGSGDNAVLAQSPSGGIPAASAGTTRPTTFGSEECDLIDPATGNAYDPNRTETIYNLVDLVIPENVIFKAERVGNKYIVDVASCPPPTGGPVFPTP